MRALGLIGAPGPPSHSDLTQLWQAINAFFNKQYITTAITKTVYGAGANFSDLNAAMMWLSNYIITPTGFVTFLCSPGKWNHTQSVELNHANIARVAIQGAAMNANPQGSLMSVTGYNSSTDGINQAIYLRSCYQTELHFDGGVSGLVILRGGCTLRYLLITGDLSVASGPPIIWGKFGIGSGLECYDRVLVNSVSVWGFGKGGWYLFGPGSIYSDSSIGCAVSYCTNSGIMGYNGYCSFGFAEVILCSCGQGGLFCYAGYYAFHKVNVRGNACGGFGGMTFEAGAQGQAGSGTMSQNSGYGVTLAGASTFLGENCTYSYNGSGGASLTGTCTAWLDYSSFYGNGGSDVWAGGCSYAEIIGSSISSGVSAGNGAVIAGP